MSSSSIRALTPDKREYCKVFGLGFLILAVMLLPVVIYNGGYFTYYGDFNAQQIPFYYHCHDWIRTQGLGWDWQTDLGANFIGSYSFYLIGSPFFWLTMPFPTKVVPYLMPWLLCLKHAVAALTAYAYLRRFVRSHYAATVGAILYAYSGFQLYNIFFNHFQDVTAFFPLLLIALEERVNQNRRGVFALTAALMAMLNYFFFTGQVVFVILYFIFRCFCKDFKITVRTFFGIALESILGVGLSAMLLLPSALSVMNNSRVSEHLKGLDMLLYSDRTRIWRIIQSFFMIPDVPARTNLFSSESVKWSSIGGYLPLFSMVGVCTFWKMRKSHWATRLTILCAFCAMVPILNSMFYTFNSAYYARWFYMPILIFCLMTAVTLDDPKISLLPGIRTTAIMLGIFLLMSFAPKDGKDVVGYDVLPNFPGYFYLIWGLCAISLGFVYLIHWLKKRAKPYKRLSMWATCGASLLCVVTVMAFGLNLGPYPHQYINLAIRGGEEISLPEADDQFYRVDISEDYDNYTMFWGYSNMRCFQSVVPVSIMEFYDMIGVTRDVASRADPSHYTLRGLFSVEYFFNKTNDEEAETIPEGFTKIDTQNGFDIYHNDCYIPMGFTFDYYAREAEVTKKSKTNIERLLIKALVLNESQEEKYSQYMTLIPQNAAYGLTEDDYRSECENRAAASCDTFVYDNEGFTAQINLDAPNLVFFSVPYEDGWTATVNGVPVDVERVDYGFMAVLAQEGKNEIVFSYETPGLRTGLIISGISFLALLSYLIIGIRLKRMDDAKRMPHTYSYDYDAAEPDINTAYIQQLAARDTNEEKGRE